MMPVIPLIVPAWVLFVRHKASLHGNLAGVGEVHIFGIGLTAWRDSTMTRFKLLSVTAILSTVIATPGIAQQAVQEPGLRAFYQSLGVGSGTSGTASAIASLRSSGSYASALAKHHARTSPKHYARAHKR